MKFNEIKEIMVDAEAEKVAAKTKAEKVAEDYLDLTCSLIEGHMSFNPETNNIFATIQRNEMSSEYWDKFESNGILINTRLPYVLNRKLDGVKLAFNTLDYGKRIYKEVEYIFFSFNVELDN